MKHAELILLHPPISYKFRELQILHGPSNVAVPSSPIFENYPIGFLTLSEYLNRQGISVKIVNLAVKMLLDAATPPGIFLSGTGSQIRSWLSFPAGDAFMTAPPAAVPCHRLASSADGSRLPSGLPNSWPGNQ